MWQLLRDGGGFELDTVLPVLEGTDLHPHEVLVLLYARDHVAQPVYLLNQRSENAVELSSRSTFRTARRAAAC